jgi:hypothetical protein
MSLARFSTARGDAVTKRVLIALVFSFAAIAALGQATPDFTGHWGEQTSSKVQRELEVQQKGQDLRVKTVVTDSSGTRNLEVRYAIGGPATIYKGLDGDEFHTSVRWDTSSLLFDTIELEDSKRIPQKVVWTLSADGNTLRVDRQITKAGKTTQSLTSYLRQP